MAPSLGTTSLERISELVKRTAPLLDDAILEYILSFFGDTASLTDSVSSSLSSTSSLTRNPLLDAIAEFLNPLLADAGGEDDDVDMICREIADLVAVDLARPGTSLAALLDRTSISSSPSSSSTYSNGHSSSSHSTNTSNGTAAASSSAAEPGLVRLTQSVWLADTDSMSATHDLASPAITDVRYSVSQTSRAKVSTVDQKKLKEQEAKQAAKQLKRKGETGPTKGGWDSKAPPQIIVNQPNRTSDGTKDIRAEDFDLSYAGHPILRGAALHLASATAEGGGRRYGLVGRNGIGKTTLLRAISAKELYVPDNVSVLHVEQEITGDSTTVLDAVLSADTERSRLLALVETLTNTPSEDSNALTKVYAQLSAIDADGAEARAGAILAGLGFDKDQQRRQTRTFSGGWRMRIALARALFVKPDVLLLDEPTNMLDFPAVVWLEKYLSTWPTTLLVVSHDRAFLDSVATDIIHQHSLKLDHYRGDFSTFVRAREERKKQRVREYEAQLQYRQHLQAFIDRWRYNANRAAQAQSKIKILEKLPPLEPPTKEEDEGLGSGGSHIYFRFEEPEKLSPPVIKMDSVKFGYNIPRGPVPPDAKIILDNVTFDLSNDSKVAVVGPNGAGKTTLLKLITGEVEAVSGLVTRHGRLRIAYFSQHHVDALEMNLTPVQFLAKKFPGRSEEEFRRQLGKFGITGPTGLQILGTLSGGQKSRVVFAWLNMTLFRSFIPRLLSDDVYLLLEAERLKSQSLASEVVELQDRIDAAERAGKDEGGDVARVADVLEESISLLQPILPNLPTIIDNISHLSSRLELLESRDVEMMAWADEQMEAMERCTEEVKSVKKNEEKWKEAAESREGEPPFNNNHPKITNLTVSLAAAESDLKLLRARYSLLESDHRRLTSLAREAVSVAEEAVVRGERAEIAVEKFKGWREWRDRTKDWRDVHDSLVRLQLDLDEPAVPKATTTAYSANFNSASGAQSQTYSHTLDPCPSSTITLFHPTALTGGSSELSQVDLKVATRATTGLDPTWCDTPSTTVHSPPSGPATPRKTSVSTSKRSTYRSTLSARVDRSSDTDDDETAVCERPWSPASNRERSVWAYVPEISVTPASPTARNAEEQSAEEEHTSPDFGLALGFQESSPTTAPPSKSSAATSPATSLRMHNDKERDRERERDKRGLQDIRDCPSLSPNLPPRVDTVGWPSETQLVFQRQRSSWPDKRRSSTSVIPSMGQSLRGSDNMHYLLPPSSAMAVGGDGGQKWASIRSTGNTFNRMKTTELSAEDRFAGSTNVALSDVGKSQAKALGIRLAGTSIAAVYASPMDRCITTAKTILSERNDIDPLPVQVMDGLKEIDHGKWEGKTRAEVQAANAEEYKEWDSDPFTYAPPGGETGLSVRETYL
ncbi:hypothetical protein HDU93_000932 [Gonapodya sp. JEL0774]|nr:hypothetical protein HDU93_000932 [Gonapodya sp. JEL0774]